MLEKQRDEDRVPKAGQRWRVEAWLTFWVQTIAAPPNVSENTHSGYSVDVRVHLIPGIGARHTAATVLAILAVPTPTAMAIMGWSSAAMATRYQHVLDSILMGVAGQVGGLLWDDPENDPAAADDEDDGDNGTAGVPAPV